MHIRLITPAPPKSRAGNRATATRWADILRKLGHRVEISTDYEGKPADIMIALHAWRSAGAIQQFADRYPEKPLIVVMTGTDAYRFIHSHPEITLNSISLADHLVGLHSLIANTVPSEYRDKMHVIFQSAKPVARRHLYKKYFHVSVIGHLRDEKDPLRVAYAVRGLPSESRIQVHHFGKPITPVWRKKVVAEVSRNHRYRWHEEIAHYRIRQIYQRTQLLVLPSRMEGGANVISEAVAAGVPVIASDIEGSVGLLGKDYAGYYPVGNTAALKKLLMRAENDVEFYRQLEKSCLAKQRMFLPEQESQGWKDLLDKIQLGVSR